MPPMLAAYATLRMTDLAMSPSLDRKPSYNGSGVGVGYVLVWVSLAFVSFHTMRNNYSCWRLRRRNNT